MIPDLISLIIISLIKMLFVILKIGERIFNISLPDNSVEKLRAEFLFLCNEDESLKQLVSSSDSYTFNSVRPELHGTHMKDWLFVIRATEELKMYQEVIVKFHKNSELVVPIENTAANKESPVNISKKRQPATADVPVKAELISSRVSAEIGMPTVAPLSVTSEHIDKLKKLFKKSVWDSFSEYEQKNELELFMKHGVLQTLGVIPKDVPYDPQTRGCTSKLSMAKSKKKPSDTIKSTSGVVNKLPTRRSSRIINQPDKGNHTNDEDFEETDDEIFFATADERANKNNDTVFQVPTIETLQREWLLPLVFSEDDFIEQDNILKVVDSNRQNNISTDEISQTDEPQPSTSAVSDTESREGDLSSSPHQSVQNKENADPTGKKPPSSRKPPRKYIPKSRGWGQEITEHNALPEFPEALQTGLHKNDYSMVDFLACLRLHVYGLIGNGAYPKPTEYDLLAQALIAEYKYLADDPETKKGFLWIRTCIRKTLSNNTRNANNKSQDFSENQQVVPEDTSEVSSNSGCVPEMEELQSWNPQLTNNRKLFLIRKTLQHRLQIIKATSNMDEYLKNHPHYMEGNMMLFEYAVVLKRTSHNQIDFQKLQSNAIRTLHILLSHFKVSDTTRALELLQEKVVPKKYQKEHIAMPFSTIHINEAQGDCNVLYTNHDVQSPCLLQIVDVQEDKHVIKRSVLKMGKGMVSTILEPSPSTALLHLMAPYFIFDHAYPKAYESILRFLEKNVHGFLCPHTTLLKPKKEYVTFMKELGDKV